MGVIKAFSEFINESIWSDMQDRSMGKIKRKEDIKPQDYEHWWSRTSSTPGPGSC